MLRRCLRRLIVIHREATFRLQRRGVAQLAHEYIRSEKLETRIRNGEVYPGHEELKTTVVLHGILGNHRNLRQLANKLANVNQDNQMLLVTHRGHGDSEVGYEPHTVRACAHDLAALLESEGIESLHAVIGHSFGGKVTIGLLEHLVEHQAFQVIEPPNQAWILDSPPGAWDPEHRAKTESPMAQESVVQVLRNLKEVVGHQKFFMSKQQFLEEFTMRGFTMGLSQWLSLNLKPSLEKPGQYYFNMDLNVVETLMEDHKNLDCWPFLCSDDLKNQGTEVYFVQAEYSDGWSKAELAQFDTCTNPNIHLKFFPGAGHWLHAEKPNELVDLMAPRFAKNE